MKHTETTERLLSALRQLDKIDPEKLQGSGFDVAFYSYTEDLPDHMQRVTILGADCGPLVGEMRAALVNAINERRFSLEMQLRNIERAMNERGQSSTPT